MMLLCVVLRCDTCTAQDKQRTTHARWCQNSVSPYAVVLSRHKSWSATTKSFNAFRHVTSRGDPPEAHVARDAASRCVSFCG